MLHAVQDARLRRRTRMNDAADATASSWGTLSMSAARTRVLLALVRQTTHAAAAASRRRRRDVRDLSATSAVDDRRRSRFSRRALRRLRHGRDPGVTYPTSSPRSRHSSSYPSASGLPPSPRLSRRPADGRQWPGPSACVTTPPVRSCRPRRSLTSRRQRLQVLASSMGPPAALRNGRTRHHAPTPRHSSRRRRPRYQHQLCVRHGR